jgi:hypothetical protein
MLSFQRCVGVGLAALGLWGAAVGCGGGNSKPDSYASIKEGIESPTGTVSQTTVTKIGEKFESASANTFSGMREDDQVGQSGSFTQTIACPEGGTLTSTGSGNQRGGRGSSRFNDCCFTEGCCASGTGTAFYSTEQSAEFNICASYDMDFDCRGVSASIEYSACIAAGRAVLLIDVDGQSFAVTGTRSGGNGTLEIKGANGTWSCTFSSGSGSCSSSGGASFTFSKG